MTHASVSPPYESVHAEHVEERVQVPFAIAFCAEVEDPAPMTGKEYPLCVVAWHPAEAAAETVFGTSSRPRDVDHAAATDAETDFESPERISAIFGNVATAVPE